MRNWHKNNSTSIHFSSFGNTAYVVPCLWGIDTLAPIHLPSPRFSIVPYSGTLYLAYEELTRCSIFTTNSINLLYLAYEELTLVKSSPDLSRAFTVVPCLWGIDTMIFLSIKVSLISHCCTLPMRNWHTLSFLDQSLILARCCILPMRNWHSIGFQLPWVRQNNLLYLTYKELPHVFILERIHSDLYKIF